MPRIYKTAWAIPSSAGPTGNHVVHGFGIYVGGPASGTGDVAVVTRDAQYVVFKNVPAGTILPVHHQKVLGVTGATAPAGVGVSGVTYATTAKDIISLI